ncbi:MAG: SDR family oxidoreductase [Chloroflexi bacterium]|nr:SDR family oxidoreductase [Chloroflexota bacterium]MDA1297930.1 SDR family oxidoreductase [Chloroflexota bacterium]
MPALNTSLQGKVAIVTGAGRGIGRAVAEELARNGAKVIVNDAGVALDGAAQSGTPADETVAAIKALGGEAAPVIESVATWQGGQRIVEAALDTFGRIDIVVTAAGILRDRMIYNMTEQEWDDVIAVHLKGTASVVRHAAPIFRKQRGGRIITFSSESGLVGFSGQANYGAAKAAIAGFTKVLAKDLGKYGVTSNSIAPRAETRMVESIPDSVKDNLREQGLMPAKGEQPWKAEDVAPFVAYLASDYSAPINGQVFLVYGGTVTHLSLPRRTRTIYNPNPPGRWELPELDRLTPRYLVPDKKLDRKAGPARRLEGKVAVVTGAGRGIGRGVAKMLAAEGASVVVADIGAALDGAGNDTSPAAMVVEEISELGGKAVACYQSVAQMEGGANIVKTALDTFGRLDIVVTAAGILRDRMFFNMTEQEWDDVIAVHMKGTFSVVQPASQVFKEQGSGGRIITFSSVSGLYGYGGQANYGAAKEGIAGFTRVVAKDLARYNVTANVISPGAATRMTDSVPDTARARRAGEFLSPPEGMLTSDPDDVAPMIAWLASDEAAGVTGMIFHTVGNRVSVMSHPEPQRSIHKDGRWTVEELAAIIPETIGMDLINPAPPQEG